ncbi:hypothetical protein [Spirosoma sp. KNUC1025]|uniref:hypothetical protein n=1 Tax=Spirosoma sp. KNUC1025 TaxID=2894082 RepID=UPI00386F14DF|nr:hypothetical protein LN737_10390 [Spirosoma sp. KNUC1025]
MRSTCLLISFALLLLIQTGTTYAQPTNGYKDFILSGKNVILLTKTGELKRIDVASGEPGSSIDTDVPIVALSADRQGNIVAGDTNHQIKSYDTKLKTWHHLAPYTNKLIHIVFNSQNQCFLITSKGIVDVASQAVYFPDSSLSRNNQIRLKNRWFESPVCFVDHQDKLWLGFNYGEWGGDVFVFDTRKRAFAPLQTDSLKMTTNPVNGFCEDQQSVYMAGGVSHMFLTHGSIIRFTDGVATSVLQSKDRETEVEMVFDDPKTGTKQKRIGKTWRGGHQIGPIAYNPANKQLYFYSQNGFFSGSPNADLSDIKQWETILKPALSRTGGSPHAAGLSINVRKMLFTANGTLLFLSEREGIGVYDGKKLRFVR